MIDSLLLIFVCDQYVTDWYAVAV